MFWLTTAGEGAGDRLPGQGLRQSGPFPTWFRSPSAPGWGQRVLEARDPQPPTPAPAGHPPAPRESGSPARTQREWISRPGLGRLWRAGEAPLPAACHAGHVCAPGSGGERYNR